MVGTKVGLVSVFECDLTDNSLSWCGAVAMYVKDLGVQDRNRARGVFYHHKAALRHHAVCIASM